MPSDYGMISKAHIQKPKANEGNSTLDLYVLGYDRFRNLDYTSSTLKKNLKTYLNQYRMIGDVINIKDAYIINIGVDFEIITDLQVIRNCIQSIKFFLSIDNFQLNQPILVKSLENLIDNINGVQTVKRLTITNKVGIANGYSKYAYDIDGATQNKVIYPSLDPMILEIKNPNQDITGRVVTL